MSESQLIKLLGDVVKCRERVAVLKRAQAEARQNMEESWGWAAAIAPILEQERIATESLAAAEAEVRDAAIGEYKETGSKAPAPGIGIRVMTRLSYDSGAALKWAVEHKIALALDKPAFEKLVRSGAAGMPVTITEEPIATIAADLEKALAEAERKR